MSIIGGPELMGENVLRAKMWYFTQQMQQSRENLDRVKETEIALQNLLKMKTRKAIVESTDKAMGGPTAMDNRALLGMLTGRRPSLTRREITCRASWPKSNRPGTRSFQISLKYQATSTISADSSVRLREIGRLLDGSPLGLDSAAILLNRRTGNFIAG